MVALNPNFVFISVSMAKKEFVYFLPLIKIQLQSVLS